MVFLLLAWLIPFVVTLLCLYLIEDETATVRDALQLAGFGLIPFYNWWVLYIILVELIKDSDKIQEFLNKKLK